MKTTLVLITFFVATVVAAKFTQEKTHNISNGKLGIFGGKSTTIQKHPHVASVVIFGSSFCAATIVSESWVVAPMLCVNGLGPESVFIVVGSNDGVTGTTYNATQMVMHPKFSVQTNYLDYNYVCIQIAGKFKWSKKVKAATLPSKRIADNTSLQVAGYGLRFAADGASNVLQAGMMKWQSVEVCNSTVAQVFPTVPYTARMACAYNKGKTTLCAGDWGDALVKNGVFYAQNIGSVDEGFCTADAKPGVFADILAVAGWIKATTGAKYDNQL